MTFSQLWEQLCTKRPELREPSARLEFTAANLELLLLQVYQQGQRAEPMPAPFKTPSRNPLDSIFGGGL